MIYRKGFFISLFFALLLVSCSTEFSFVQISDPQFGFMRENKSISEESALYEKAVSEINGINPAAVIITGDLVNDRTNATQWNEFRRITSLIKSKNVFITPGNHDIGQEPTGKDLDEFRTMFGYDRFSFMHKKCAFIGFNSNLIKAGTPGLEEEQYKWLENELSKSSGARQTFLFCHHPFFINDPDEPEEYFNIKPEVRKKYLALFARYGVDAVFAGHLHKNAVAQAGNIKIITTSSAGKQLGKDLPGFRVVKVSGDKFTHEYVNTGAGK
ncbi:MAG TPA: metallophosphoesterase [Bacteroidales bacterium]|nr:metallophosphoesterase [Bacteroidales bacterium]